jgi:hypothetical protein
MSISIEWRLVQPKSWKSLPGTSSDWGVFERIFPRRVVTCEDVEKLVAMHCASGLDRSLWGELADALNELPEGSEIEVRGEW